MRHETFKHVAVGEAFEAIEGSILPSLTMLIESAAVAQPGDDAVSRADELRALARQLESLTALFAPNSGQDSAQDEPVEALPFSFGEKDSPSTSSG